MAKSNIKGINILVNALGNSLMNGQYNLYRYPNIGFLYIFF